MSQADSTNTTGLYLPTPVTPEEAFQAIGLLRKEARDEIDRLIRFLDDTENHMEREPEDEGDDSELEEDDPAEHAEPLEPSLGAFEGHDDQTVSWRAVNNRSDRELDPAESGIGDQDGLDEQVPFRDWQGAGMV